MFPHRSALRFPLRLLGFGLFGLVAFWACDGGNLFGPGTGIGPRIIELNAPPTIDSGEEVPVGVHAVGSIRVDSIVVGATVGDFHATEVVSLESGELDVRVEPRFAVPSVITDTLLTLTAQAVDAQGNASERADRVVRAIDLTPPAVAVTLQQEEVSLGKDVGIEVGGQDNIGLAQLGFRILGPEGDTVAFEVEKVDGRTASRTFVYTVPENLSLGEFKVEGVATDLEGNVGSAPADAPLRVVFIDDEPPEVEILAPTQGSEFHAHETVPTEVRVRDNGAVARVTIEGVALRGDPDLGTEEKVTKFDPWTIDLMDPSADTTLTRILEPTNDFSPEEVTLIVTAEDTEGNVGSDTLTFQLLPERAAWVDFHEPLSGSGIPVGDSVFVRAGIEAPSGIARVTFDGVAHRGDPDLGTDEEVLRFHETTVELGGAVNDTTLLRYLQPTADESTETVFIRAAVEDGVGNVTRDSVDVLVGGPSVRITAPEEGDVYTDGQTVEVTVEASDNLGISRLDLFIGGVVEDTRTRSFSGNPPSVTETWAIELPEDEGGALTLQARARNSEEIESHTPILTVNVMTGEDDTIAPELMVIPTAQGADSDPNRVERTDVVEVEVKGQDNPGGVGVRIIGFTLRALPQDRAFAPDPTMIVRADTIADPEKGEPGLQSAMFEVAVEDLYEAFGFDPAFSPDTLLLDFVGFMVDGAENCGASVSATTFQRLDCDESEPEIVTEEDLWLSRTIGVVSGETVRLPAGGSIADAVVHEGTGALILSNFGLNRLELFDLEERTFLEHAAVGSQPWGMTFDSGDPDVLYVANSGGTNFSRVERSGASWTEDGRIATPNALLWDVEESSTESGIEYQTTFHSFSDRPQFVAHDVNGLFVFSTRPTGTAPDGTIRIGDDGLGLDMAVRLVTEHGMVVSTDDAFAIGGVDRMVDTTRTVTVDGEEVQERAILARTHQPGDRDDVRESSRESGFGATADVVEELRDIVLDPTPTLFQPRHRTGTWDVSSVGLSDTTFIAASTDGSSIVVGEGATESTGRIFLWDAGQEEFADHVSVTDLTGNASERVLGVAINQDGELGVGRGLFAAYFFDPDLRLEGEVLIEPGGAGVALHPLHSGGPLTAPDAVSLAFVPVGGGVVEIHGTRHFELHGRAFVRDTMLGPVRATLPFTSDNDGLTCVETGGAVDPFDSGTDDACVIVKLSGPSAGGGVVVVDIKAADVRRGPS